MVFKQVLVLYVLMLGYINCILAAIKGKKTKHLHPENYTLPSEKPCSFNDEKSMFDDTLICI